jgi:hypothetical protein
MGRSLEFSQEVADHICEQIAEGRSLRAILREDENLPASSTIFKWLAHNESFAEQYARAREAQADSLFDEILTIADDGLNDSYTDEEGNVRTNQDVIARSRLRVDARKWMAGKLRPKVYGEKIQTELSGNIGIAARQMSDAELEAIAASGGA